MKKLHYQITVQASRKEVWDVLWKDESYRKWAGVFSEGSHAVTDWNKGSKVLFLSANGDGMVSMIAENKPQEFMSFNHLGMIINGKEDFESEKVKEWAGVHENYHLKEMNGETVLTVEMDTTEEFQDYFNGTWPLAMKKIKELSEENKAG